METPGQEDACRGGARERERAGRRPAANREDADRGREDPEKGRRGKK